MFPNYRVRQSRASSVLGMIVGLFFIFIGITQFLELGLFGILWTLVASIMTITQAINVFSNKGVPTYDIEMKGSHSSIKTPSENNETKIRQLHRLKIDNIISEEEFQKKKNEILNSKW